MSNWCMRRKPCHGLGLTLGAIIALVWVGCGQSEDIVGPTAHGPKIVSKRFGDAAADQQATGPDTPAAGDSSSGPELLDVSADASGRDVMQDVAADSSLRDAQVDSGVPADSAVPPESGADAGDWGARDAGGTCFASELMSPTPSVFPLDAYVTQVRINSGGSVATSIAPGAEFTVQYDYKIQSEPSCYCPGCVQQIYVGFPGQAPPTCVSVSRGCPGTSQTNRSVTLRAPTTPGAYYLSVGSSWEYTCTGAPSAEPGAYVGVICVQ